MQRTKIEWVRNPDGTPGYTFNPITGCLGPFGTPSRPKPCFYCYAHKLARGRLKKLYLSNTNIIPDGNPFDPFTPRFWPSRLTEPFRLKKPSRIFVCSMGDPFSHAYPRHWLSCIFYTITNNPRHTFILLTKKPSAALDLGFPPNLWLGVTITCPAEWHRVPILLRSTAKVKFISFEPLLGNVFRDRDLPVYSGFPNIDWIIVGAQTKPTHIPPSPWVYHIIDATHHEGIPLFLKPNLHWPGPPIQEFPKVAEISHSSPGIPRKSGDVSQKFRQPEASENDANLSSSQGQSTTLKGGTQ